MTFAYADSTAVLGPLSPSPEPGAYDLVVAVFIQFLSPDQRPGVFDGLARTLRPGGRLAGEDWLAADCPGKWQK